MSTTTPTTPAGAGIPTPSFATVDTSAMPEVRSAIGGAFEGMRSTRQMSVDARVENMMQQYEGSNGIPLLDKEDLEVVSAASGFDDIKGKGGRNVLLTGRKGAREQEAKNTMEVAAQEAAMLGAMSKDGKLSKDDMIYLTKRYGDAMHTSTIASSGVGKVGRGVFGMMAGAAVGGFGAFMASIKNNGFIKSAFIGFAGAAAGALGGSFFPKLADKMKASLGFGFGLAADDHTAKFEKAMKLAAEKGHKIAREHDLDVVKISRKRSFGKETEAEVSSAVSPSVAAVVSASAPAVPAAVAPAAPAAVAVDDTLKAIVDSGMDRRSLPKEVQDKISAAIKTGDVHVNYDAYAMMAASTPAKTEAPVKTVEAPASLEPTAKDMDWVKSAIEGSAAPVAEAAAPKVDSKKEIADAIAAVPRAKTASIKDIAAEFDEKERIALKGVVKTGEAAKGSALSAVATPTAVGATKDPILSK